MRILLNGAVSSSSSSSLGRLTLLCNERKMMWKEAVVAQFEVASGDLPERRSLSSEHIRCLGHDSKSASPETRPSSTKLASVKVARRGSVCFAELIDYQKIEMNG
jgi:hypothetical protein